MRATANRNTRGEARRAELLRGGVDLVRARGPERVSVGDVTACVGVSKSLFYWYFRDLEDLIRQALNDAVHVIRAALADAVKGIDDPLERIERRMRTALGLIENDDGVRFLVEADAYGWAASEPYREVASGADDLLFDIVRDIAEAQAHGDVRTDVPAFLLAGCVRSVFADGVARYLRGQTRVAPAELVEAGVRFSLQGLAPPPRQVPNANGGCDARLPHMARG